MEVSIALAFAAGLLSFASPCVLALVPVYLAFLGESASAVAPMAAVGSAAGSAGSATLGTPARMPADPESTVATGPVLGQAVLFVLGFSAVFVVLGTPVGVLGQGLFQVAAIRQVAGGAVILLGLATMGVFGPVLERFSISGPGASALPPGRVARALALGAFVAIGWTPCIGAVLGAILAMGASASQVPIAVLLLVSYSAGLAVPFLAAAVALPHLRPVIAALRRHHRAISIVSGLLIVAIGLLIFANAFSRMASLFTFL